jgi:hypothetical protein
MMFVVSVLAGALLFVTTAMALTFFAIWLLSAR